MNRDRWNGWVTFAWLIVVLSVIAGIFMISTLETIEVPNQDFRGNITWQEEPNPAVWGVAIGQGFAAAMLAAIFSMLNSIYQNSCDLLARQNRHKSNRINCTTTVNSTENTTTTAPEKTISDNMLKLSPSDKMASDGQVIFAIERTSPVYRLLRPGYAICKVNGQEVCSQEKMMMDLVQGKNLIEYADAEDQKYEIRIKLNPDDLGVVLMNNDTV